MLACAPGLKIRLDTNNGTCTYICDIIITNVLSFSVNTDYPVLNSIAPLGSSSPVDCAQLGTCTCIP